MGVAPFSRVGRWRVPIAALAAALFVAACTGTPAASPSGAASPSASAAAKRGGGDLLRILYWQAPTILNTHLAQGTKDYDAGGLILEPLAKFGPDGKPVPYLAAEIPTIENGGVSKDLTTVTWKLKQNVKWSDGSDFTADDVVFTWKYVTDEKTNASDADTMQGIKSVEAVDKNTVKLTWDAPNPNPYQAFSSGLGNVLQKKQYEPCIGDKAEQCPDNNKPIGTGPYKLDQFKPGDVVTYVINDLYRDANKPFFKQVQIKGVDDATAAGRAACQSGDSDYSWNMQVEASVMQQIMAGGKCVINSAVSPNVERILINRANPNAPGDQRSEPTTKHPFFSDLNVRKAFAMAIDRDTMAKQLYGEAGTGTCNIVTAPDSIASQNTKSLDVCKFDAAAAAKLLDDAGWVKGSDGIRAKGGVKMKVTYNTSTNDLRQKEQAFVKQAWEALGVQVELHNTPAKVFFGSDVGNPDTAAHMYYDVEMFTNGSDQPDPTNYLAGWQSSRIAQKSNNWKGDNYERFNSKEYDDLFAQFKKETDQTKRNQLAIQMNDLLVKDVVIIPLVARKFPIAAAAKDLKGLKPTPWDSDLWNIADWSK